MKIIVAPDKFKGSLTSFEVCNAISEGIKRTNPAMEIASFPLADGGDGFAAVMKYYLGTKTIECASVDPLGREIQGVYEWDDKSNTAIVEMAVASGLVLLNGGERNPLITSTYGTGLLIKDAIGKGAVRIILGLGGSATNEAGTGILSALGFQFLNEKNEPLRPRGGELPAIKRIVNPSYIPEIKFEIACDVQNILYGPQGAAYVYAPQKGANPEQVEFLDKGLRNFAGILEQHTGKKISGIPGSGAAGGIAAGLMSFFDVNMKKGIEMVVDASKLREQLKGADLVITGEGKIDQQSASGKVVGNIAGLSKQFLIPAIAVCGELQLNEAGIQNLGLQKILALTDDLIDKDTAIKNAKELIAKKMEEFIKAL